MKSLVFLLMLITSTLFSQECTTYNSTFYKYTYKKGYYFVEQYDIESEVAYEYLSAGEYIKISTDLQMSNYISDSITKLFGNGKPINPDKTVKLTQNIINKTVIDSATNLLFNNVYSTCDVCRNSIIDMITTDEDMVKVFKSKRVTQINVIYFQIIGQQLYEVTIVDVGIRFGWDERYIYVNE